MDVIVAGDVGYEAVRRPRIARFEGVRPAAVVRCRTSADVVEALVYARERGVGLAVRSGGHCFAGRSSTTGVLIDVSPINDVSLDGGVVTVGAGAKLGDIYDALEPHGLTIAGGCGPTVGIAGLALGGGLGILGRRHGLTCDQVTSAEVVLADGRIVAAEDDLLWALKGAGGGQFGIVTRLTLRTVPAPPNTTCFHLSWPYDRAAELIDRWQRWAPDAPDHVAASLIVRPPVVHLFGAAAGDVELPDAETETTVQLPFREAKRWLADNGPAGGAEGPEHSKSEFFRDPLPQAAVQALVEHYAGAEHRELDFSPWGGAYNRVAPDATAFPHRDARFLLKQTAPLEAKPWLDRAYAITHPYGTGGAYVNFPDLDLEDPLTAYHGINVHRLRSVKAKYDPHATFQFPQMI
jgi:FAD/FMN-containing dehydrogenase